MKHMQECYNQIIRWQDNCYQIEGLKTRSKGSGAVGGVE